MRFLIFSILILFNVSLLTGQKQDTVIAKKEFFTKRILDKAPLIDGILDEPIWNSVAWSGDFVQHEPDNGAAPSQKTKFKILYDDNNLYVAVFALDTDPSKIVKRMSRRDGFEGDWVEINIGSHNDGQTAFSFTASVSGVKGDEYITNNGNNWDSDWDPLWYVKTSINTEGWIAEFRIPFTELRFDKSPHQEWDLQLTRRLFRKNERSTWQRILIDKGGWVSQFGKLKGIENIVPKRQIQIAPYVSTSISSYEKEEGNPFRTGSNLKFNAGVDGRVGLSNNFTLNFTINPDFGQVEADPSQVNLSAFEIFFQERRPFFIESRNITSFKFTNGGSPYSRDNLFYSRRIGRSPHNSPDLADGEYADNPNQTSILGALKLTGKTKNGWSIGLIETIAAEEKAEIDNNGERREEVVEPLTNYLVGRVQKDFDNNNSIIGLMLTNTHRFINPQDSQFSYLPDNAYTGGIDFTHFWKEQKYYFKANYGMSNIRGSEEAIQNLQESSRRFFQRPDNNYTTFDPTKKSLTGQGGNLEIGKQTAQGWRYLAWLSWRSPSFELNDVGFNRQGDILFQVFWLSYRWAKPIGIFNSLNLSMDQWTGWDFGGNRNFAGTQVSSNANFKNQWSGGMGLGYELENLSNTALRGGPAMKIPGSKSFYVWGETDNRKKVTLGLNYSTFVGHEESRKGYDVGLDLSYRPSNAISIAFVPDYAISENKLQYIDKETVDGKEEYVFGTLNQTVMDLTVRVDWTITPNFTIQYYGSPFVATGDFSDTKFITNSKANKFEDRFTTDIPEGIRNSHAVDNDFNFRQFRSNLVLRWEYHPGSLLYFVWTQGRTDQIDNGRFDFGNDFSGLFDVAPENVFLVKMSYLFKN